MRSALARPLVLFIGIPAILVMGSGSALLIFFQTHKPPAPLGLATPRPAASISPNGPSAQDPCKPPARTAGSDLWLVQRGSQAGYRAHELFVDIGLHEAVARTEHVIGYAVITQRTDPAVVASVCVSVEANYLKSIDVLPPPLPAATDRDQHIPDLLDTANHPFVVFEARQFELSARALTGEVTTSKVAGSLSMRGRQRDVTADLTGKVVGQEASVAGSMVVHVPDWGMDVPGEPAVQPDVTIEFAIQLSKA